MQIGLHHYVLCSNSPRPLACGTALWT